MILENLNLKDIDNLVTVNSKWKQKYIYLDLSEEGSTNKDQIAEMRKEIYFYRHSNILVDHSFRYLYYDVDVPNYEEEVQCKREFYDIFNDEEDRKTLILDMHARDFTYVPPPLLEYILNLKFLRHLDVSYTQGFDDEK